MSLGNEVSVFWVPAHSGIIGNETEDQFAKEAAGGQLQHSVLDELRWEASLSHLSRVITENRSRATAQWISSHVRPERRHKPPTGLGLRRKSLRRVRKSLASRYYQLLSGHAAIGSFLKRESRHHIFVECKAWASRSGGCGSGWPRTASGSIPGASGAEAVEGGSHKGCSRVPGGRASGVLAGGEGEGTGRGGGRGCGIGGRGGRPGAALGLWFCVLYGKLYGLLSLRLFLLSVSIFSFVWRGGQDGGRRLGSPSLTLRSWGHWHKHV